MNSCSGSKSLYSPDGCSKQLKDFRRDAEDKLRGAQRSLLCRKSSVDRITLKENSSSPQASRSLLDAIQCIYQEKIKIKMKLFGNHERDREREREAKAECVRWSFDRIASMTLSY